MREFIKGSTVQMVDGRSATIVDVDPERDCLWVLVDGEQHDRKVWTREVANGVLGGENGWRPIASAPRDGTPILLWWKHREPRRGRWVSEESGTGWKCDGDQVVPAKMWQGDAMYWQPMPGDPSGVSGMGHEVPRASDPDGSVPHTVQGKAE